MGILGERLPDGFTIEEVQFNGKTEYRLNKNGTWTGYSTFKRNLAVSEAKRRAGSRR